MMTYIEALKEALIIFPFVAIVMSVPVSKSQHDKFGKIDLRETTIIYTFVFYLICAYALIIFPLPSANEIGCMVGVGPQLVPFQFVRDLIRENPLVITDPKTYFSAITDSTVLVVVFNILLTLPLGVYLKNCFKMSKTEVVLCAFALSLFFELTQLTGLFFIFPKAYRMFDVDDLMLNTLGGLIGYAIATKTHILVPNTRKSASMIVLKTRSAQNIKSKAA